MRVPKKPRPLSIILDATEYDYWMNYMYFIVVSTGLRYWLLEASQNFTNDSISDFATKRGAYKLESGNAFRTKNVRSLGHEVEPTNCSPEELGFFIAT